MSHVSEGGSGDRDGAREGDGGKMLEPQSRLRNELSISLIRVELLTL